MFLKNYALRILYGEGDIVLYALGQTDDKVNDWAQRLSKELNRGILVTKHEEPCNPVLWSNGQRAV